MALSHVGATLEWLHPNQLARMTFLICITLPKPKLSNMIDCPPRPGESGRGPPGMHDSGYPQFLNIHLIIRCKYETRIPSNKLCGMHNLISDNSSGNITPPQTSIPLYFLYMVVSFVVELWHDNSYQLTIKLFILYYGRPPHPPTIHHGQIFLI